MKKIVYKIYGSCLGRFAVTAVFLLFFVASSWATCQSVSYAGYFCAGCNAFCESDGTTECANAPKCDVCEGGIPSVCRYSTVGYLTGAVESDWCRSAWRRHVDLTWTILCDTQAEADSVSITAKCTSGTVTDSTINGNREFFCQNGSGDSYLTFGFYNFSTGTHGDTLKYWIKTSTGYEEIDEGTYNHLAALACVDVALYRGVLNGKYVYWYSNEQEPVGVINVVRIK